MNVFKSAVGFTLIASAVFFLDTYQAQVDADTFLGLLYFLVVTLLSFEASRHSTLGVRQEAIGPSRHPFVRCHRRRRPPTRDIEYRERYSTARSKMRKGALACLSSRFKQRHHYPRTCEESQPTRICRLYRRLVCELQNLQKTILKSMR